MDNVLFLHHFESMWEKSMLKFGTTIEEQTEKVIDFLDHTNIDKVILTRFEENKFGDEHYPIIRYCEENNIQLELNVYAYPLRTEDEYLREIYPLETENKNWCQGTRDTHDENCILDIEDFHKELKSCNKVYLAGAFENECILDQEAIFDAIGVNYEKIEGLVVGDYCLYEYKGERIDDILEEIIDKYEDRMKNITFDTNIDTNFNALVLIDADEVESIIDDLKNELEEHSKKIESSGISINSCFKEFTEILEGIIYQDEYNYDNIIDKIEDIRTLKENTQRIDEATYFHGTHWLSPTKDDDFSHAEIHLDYNDNNAVYFSNSEDVAINFAENILRSSEGEIPVIFKLNIEIEKAYLHDTSDKDLRVFDAELSLEDREALYKVFSDNGYDAFIIPNNYPEGSDVAYFKNVDSIKEAKAYINNKWTDFMDVENLKSLVIENSLENKNIKKIKIKNRI